MVRQTSGVLAFRALSTGKIRGEERFHITVHPDGSRTVAAISRYGPRDIQRHSLSRFDGAFRPIDSALQYWIEGQWRASGSIVLDGTHMTVTSRSPQGEHTHNLEIFGPVALLPHQLTPDSMRVLLYDKVLGGRQAFTMYSPDALAEGPKGLLGERTTQHITFIGEQMVTVPAGTFPTDHYKIEESIDVFVTGPDAVVVKWAFPRIDREHVLMGLDQGP